MSDENPSLQDIWRLLGTMNKRFGERFDVLERQVVQIREDVAGLRAEFRELKVHMNAGFGALKESIEARDFRRGDHGLRGALDEGDADGRRLTELETSRT